MKSTDPIGGFIEWNFDTGRSSVPFKSAIALQNGRSCLRVILEHCKAHTLYVPAYRCSAIDEAAHAAKTTLRPYGIDPKMKPLDVPNLKKGEMFLFINYFGLCGDSISKLSQLYKSALIVDNTQAFFQKPSSDSWNFNSIRKFAGTPDGAYLVPPRSLTPPALDLERYSPKVDHLFLRSLKEQTRAYHAYLKNEEAMDSTPRIISATTEALIAHMDWGKVKKRRVQNFNFYHSIFRKLNMLPLREIQSTFKIPMCYPLLLEMELPKADLATKGIFLPTFWKEVMTQNEKHLFQFEKRLVTHLLCLPLDQRYDRTHCKRVAREVKKLISK